MLTSLGRFLRKLRIDNGEILKDMAEKLDVSASFLSAVENGKKHMPSEWNERISSIYSLNEVQQSDFTKAIAESEKIIEMNLVNANTGQREVAVSFARRFNNIDDSQIEAIRKILFGGNTK